ncbi:MAG: PAS domain S-box protein [Myxococcota bacterium]
MSSETSAMLRALEESEQRYRQVFETNTAPKLLIDPDGGQIVDANEAACQFYGYTKAELLSRSILSINVMPPAQITEEMERAKREERLYFRFQHRVASGKIREVDVYSRPVNVGGRKLLHSIVIDQTERRELEQRLLRAQRMETIGLLAGGVAHDFNNVLAAILGAAELARESLPPSHPTRAHLSDISSAVERAAEITRQLLSLAKKQVVEARWVSVDRVLASMEPLLRRLLGSTIRLEIQGQTSSAVRIDPGQLQQVLVNLAVNARDAMPSGGTLMIRTAELSAEAAGLVAAPTSEGSSPTWQRFVRIEVVDQGTGIPPELQSRIFEPFFTTKGGHRGTGLGLATCQVIIEQAQGRILLSSAVGSGSTFSVLLPAYDQAAESDRPATAERPAGGPEEILIVEDEPSLIRLISTTLQSYGYRIHAASDGAEALRLLTAGTVRPDLVVSDVSMPNMRGDELAARARQILPQLKVLLLSGNPEGITTPEAFLAKPFLPRQLARMVREILDA